MIRGAFYGHSHRPQYRIQFLQDEEGAEPPTDYDDDDDAELGGRIPDMAGFVSIIGGSVLTDGMNPAYSAYRVDGEGEQKTFSLLRHKVVAMKLAESNEGGEVIM